MKRGLLKQNTKSGDKHDALSVRSPLRKVSKADEGASGDQKVYDSPGRVTRSSLSKSLPMKNTPENKNKEGQKGLLRSPPRTLPRLMKPELSSTPNNSSMVVNGEGRRITRSSVASPPFSTSPVEKTPLLRRGRSSISSPPSTRSSPKKLKKDVSPRKSPRKSSSSTNQKQQNPDASKKILTTPPHSPINPAPDTTTPRRSGRLKLLTDPSTTPTTSRRSQSQPSTPQSTKSRRSTRRSMLATSFVEACKNNLTPSKKSHNKSLLLSKKPSRESLHDDSDTLPEEKEFMEEIKKEVHMKLAKMTVDEQATYEALINPLEKEREGWLAMKKKCAVLDIDIDQPAPTETSENEKENLFDETRAKFMNLMRDENDRIELELLEKQRLEAEQFSQLQKDTEALIASDPFLTADPRKLALDFLSC